MSPLGSSKIARRTLPVIVGADKRRRLKLAQFRHMREQAYPIAPNSAGSRKDHDDAWLCGELAIITDRTGGSLPRFEADKSRIGFAPDAELRKIGEIDRNPGSTRRTVCDPPAGKPVENQRVAREQRIIQPQDPSVHRRRFGAETIRSLWLREIDFDRTQAVPLVVIEGSGRGHGVGLCQWGARGMALSGAGASAILAHFFPGTAVTGG